MLQNKICEFKFKNSLTDLKFKLNNFLTSSLLTHLVMESLPHELQQKIEDMACRMQHNGAPSRYGLIVSIDVDPSKQIAADLEQSLKEWIFDSLDNAHRALDCHVEWHFVSNVKCDVSLFEDDETENRYQVCVNITPNENNEASNGLFLYQPKLECDTEVDPSAVLHHFTTPPREARSVSISGVNTTVISDEWSDCISPCPDTFARAGEGYMLHRMHTLVAEGCTPFPRMFTSHETSFSFNWPGYGGSQIQR